MRPSIVALVFSPMCMVECLVTLFRIQCMCSECANALRLHSNKCPICRQPIETILEIPNKRKEGRNAECSEAQMAALTY